MQPPTQMMTEMTEQGEQYLMSSVAPVVVTTAMRFAQAMRWRDEQRQMKARPLDIGFWSPMRNQLELF